MPLIYSQSLTVHIASHISAMTGFQPQFLLGASIEGLVADTMPLLRQLRVHEAFQVIRTWGNSWSTSDRYHERVRLPCLFGCVGAYVGHFLPPRGPPKEVLEPSVRPFMPSWSH